MAKVFLDANSLIDLIEGRGATDLAANLDPHDVYISSLSVHIASYVGKLKVPNQALQGTISQFEVVDFSRDILDKALTGPTLDLEDNIQLHSAAGAASDFFLTKDQQLLSLGYFGKTKITSHL